MNEVNVPFNSLSRDEVERVYTYIPAEYHASTFIAGGSVRDYMHTKDIDVWVLCKEDEVDVTCKTIIDYLAGNLVARTETKTYYPKRKMFKLTTVERASEDLPIQIMVYPAVNIYKLLEEFDLSEHQWALDEHSDLLWVDTSTDNKLFIRVTRFDTPYSTLRRYFNLCHRYGKRPFWPDVEKLCTAIHERAVNRASDAYIRPGEGNKTDGSLR